MLFHQSCVERFNKSRSLSIAFLICLHLSCFHDDSKPRVYVFVRHLEVQLNCSSEFRVEFSVRADNLKHCEGDISINDHVFVSCCVHSLHLTTTLLGCNLFFGWCHSAFTFDKEILATLVFLARVDIAAEYFSLNFHDQTHQGRFIRLPMIAIINNFKSIEHAEEFQTHSSVEFQSGRESRLHTSWLRRSDEVYSRRWLRVVFRQQYVEYIHSVSKRCITITNN